MPYIFKFGAHNHFIHFKQPFTFTIVIKDGVDV